MLSTHHLAKTREINMGRMKTCSICGKPTKRVLFQHSPDEVAICSKSCQTKYFQTLSTGKATKLQVLNSIDKKITTIRRCEMCCWIAAGLGLTVIVLGIHLARSLPMQQAGAGTVYFLIGMIPLTVGALATEYFSGLRRKLVEKRREAL